MKYISSFLFASLFSLIALAQTTITGVADTTREIVIAKGQTFLNFPVADSGKMVKIRISENGKFIDEFSMHLATEKPAYWVYFDASRYQGKTLTVQIAKLIPRNFGGNGTRLASNTETEPLNTKGLQMVFADSRFPGIDSLYKEKNRPQVHFTSRRGWLNDPNGLIYYKGDYHLFYQHNPYGWAWGNMHWGHAISKDLLHWNELSDALFPMNANDAAFSGSAVVDPKNTGGFRKNGIDPLIAFYTSTGRGECMKISYDNGRTFEDYKGNPILEHKGRDPKVFWYAPGNHWVMVVYDFGRTKKMSLGEEATINQNLIYTSPDLKNWTFQSGIPGFFECPDLFELPVEGEPGNSKWVMYDATGRYILGKFDGKKFTIEQNLKRYDNGGGYFYASQTYNNMPDNRRVQIGWGRGITHPGMPFNQPMLFPSELKLKRTADGIRLCPEPIKEISSLNAHTQTFKDKILKAGDTVSVSVKRGALHVIAEFEKGDATEFGVNVLGYELVYNDLIGQFLTTHAGPSSVTDYVKPSTNIFKIEAIIDENILEVFVNDGELYYVLPFNGSKTDEVDAFVKGRGGNRKVILKKLEVHELNSIW